MRRSLHSTCSQPLMLYTQLNVMQVALSAEGINLLCIFHGLSAGRQLSEYRFLLLDPLFAGC